MLRSHRSDTNWHLTFKTQIRKLDVKLQTPDGSDNLTESEHGLPRSIVILEPLAACALNLVH
jgi:hypothetical protein